MGMYVSVHRGRRRQEALPPHQFCLFLPVSFECLSNACYVYKIKMRAIKKKLKLCLFHVFLLPLPFFQLYAGVGLIRISLPLWGPSFLLPPLLFLPLSLFQQKCYGMRGWCEVHPFSFFALLFSFSAVVPVKFSYLPPECPQGTQLQLGRFGGEGRHRPSSPFLLASSSPPG